MILKKNVYCYASFYTGLYISFDASTQNSNETISFVLRNLTHEYQGGNVIFQQNFPYCHHDIVYLVFIMW